MDKKISQLLAPLERPIVIFALLLAFVFGLSLTLPLWAEGRFGFAKGLVISLAVATASAVLFCVVVTASRRLHLPTRDVCSFRHQKAFVIVCFGVIYLSYLVALLSAYPGYCSVDSMVIVNQAMGNFDPDNLFLRDGLTNHQPVLYTGLVALFIAFFSKAGVEAAIFFFLCFQSLLIALLFAWAIGWMNRHGCGRILLLIVFTAVALWPLFPVHAITLWKDGLFSAFLLVFALKLYDVALAKEAPNVVPLGMLALLVSLFRNNGIYIVVLVFLYLIWVSPCARKKIIACLGTTLLIFVVIQGPVFTLVGVQPSKFAESVGIPLQQIALISIEDGLTDDQEVFVEEIIPVEKMNSVYTPHSSNPIKFDEDFDNAFLEDNKVSFLLTWAQIVADHPITALRAWVMLTSGIWGPNQVAEIGTGSSYNGNAPIDMLGLGWNPRNFINMLQKHASLLFGKGFVVWSCAWLGMLAFALWPSNRQQRIIVYLPAVILFATLMIAVPSGWDYRYVLFFAEFLPFSLFFVADAMRTEQRPEVV